MGARGLAALVVLLLAAALLPNPASGSDRRILEGEKPSSGEDAPAPTGPAGGSPKGDPPKESGHSSAAGQKSESHRHQNLLPPAPSPPKDTKVPSAEKGKEGGEAQASASPPPPPPPAKETDSHKASPPPGGPGSNGGTNPEDTGSQVKEEEMNKMKEVMEKCDASHKCSSGKEFSACLVSDNASVGSFAITVQNEGQNEINVTVKEPSIIDIDKKPLHLANGAFGQISITYNSPDGWNITLDGGNEDCSIHVRPSLTRQSVSDLQQQFQMFAAYATRLNPIYGAYIFVFTVVLVGIVCACCKFAKRRGNDGVPYEQLEMGAQAPNSAVVDNTTSTTDGWEDGWDDDWDDEEAPARPSDKKPTSSVSANGLSLRSQTNSKDGWDVDWDD
ncbi:hypothetical protein GQ55_3G230000 [Panicum hallii var. hallii]|uniref:DUF7356 domain-containing protein n=1 Tax=Panicum hallii var. hallii TaxID=1504633 RepID=A0A2T7ECG3_9POAL|nr:hypothetical protein GQ55_3G230000 [Panicum hallii var. hallii]